MFNSGIRGRRARDGEGNVTAQASFVQKTTPVPFIRNFRVLEQDDLALEPAGGQTVILNGNGFETGLTLSIGGISISPITVINDQQISFTSPAKSAGTYSVLLVNPSGGSAVLVPGIVYSGSPNFDTAAGNIGNFYETTAISTAVSATADSAITYEIVSGSIPTGSTFNSDGTLTGTAPADAASTTYTFTVKATDQELQDSTREFSVTVNTDVISWIYPQNNQIVEIGDVNPTINLSATSAAGYGVVYSVSALPDGLVLGDNGDITGTISSEGETAATLTATAFTTDRVGSISITWRVQLGDAFFYQTTLLLNADDNTFITDASTNAFDITPVADVRPSAFSPYNTSWSNYFDGTGDYLTVPTNSSLNLEAENFTIEFWLNPSVLPGNYKRIFQISATSITQQVHEGVIFEISNTNVLSVTINGSNQVYYSINASSAIVANQWEHWAYVRNGSTLTLYRNGVSQGTASPGTNAVNYASTFVGIIGRWGSNTTRDYNGYISNLRIVKGTALYTSDFTPPTAPLTAISGTSLLTCQSNRFIDNSTNNFAITRNGDVKVTSFAPFTETDTSTGSGYFDGTGDEVRVTQSLSNFITATGDWTAEAWIYPLSFNGPQYSLPIFGSSLDSFVIRLSPNGTATTTSLNLYFVNSGSTAILGGSSSGTGSALVVKLYEWQHIAVVRSSGIIKAYVNGILRITISNDTTTGIRLTDTYLSVGGATAGSNPFFNGYISNARVVNGSAIYTEEFTPPTAPLTAVSNTSLLTLQNRIGYNNSQPIDESGINNVITRNGNASVGSFSPFVPSGWSGYFNGSTLFGHPSNAYAVWCGGTDTGFAGKTWTIETWLYITTWTSNAQNTTIIGSYQGVVANGRWVFSLGTANNSTDSARLDFTYTTSTGTQSAVQSSDDSAGKINKNQWAHVAVTIDATTAASSTIKFYVNGVLSATHTGQNLSTHTDFYDQPYIGGGCAYYNSMFGYISNFRIKRGELLTFGSLPTEPAQPDANTVYLNFRSNNFNDESASRTVVTPNAVQITPFSPFAPHTVTPDSYSVYFDGSGDYLSLADNTAFDIGLSGEPFTIESWYYPTTTTTNYQGICGRGGGFAGWNSTNGWQYSFFLYNNLIYFQHWTGSALANFNTSLTAASVANRWNHFVVSYDGSNLSIFRDGSRLATTTSSLGKPSSSTRTRIAGSVVDAETTSALGYLSNFRMVKGSAVYDPTQTTITPPTAPLTDISGTSLLACQSPTVTDNSANEFAITANGNIQPTKFNPFGETVTTDVEYSPLSHGGSVYYDGTTDFLTLTTGSDFILGTADFTIECWVYVENLSGERAIFYKYVTWTSNTDINLRINSDGSIRFLAGDNIPVDMTSSAGLIKTYSWNHIAVTRSGNSFRQFVNGVPAGTDTESTSIQNDKTTMYIGADTNGTNSIMYGYMHGLRILKGTCLYTAAFVPPLSPPTSIPGSILLINGTNAAIQDRSGRTVLETVGDARVVNGVRKYGSGAMYFDGTGDYLQIPDSNEFHFGSGDFTIEAWINTPDVTPSKPEWIVSQWLTDTQNSWGFRFETSGELRFWYATAGNTASNIAAITPGIANNTWAHVAVVRNGSTVTIYVDGVSKASGSVSGVTLHNSTANIVVGNQANTSLGQTFTGYIDDLRITKGYARYTANFTPPTSAHKLK